jgi:hypothetical protein
MKKHHETNITRIDVINTLFLGIHSSPFFPISWIVLSIYGSSINFTQGNIYLALFDFIYWILFCIIGIWLISFAYVFTSQKMSKGVLGTHKFTLRDDGLFEETKYSECLYRWNSIDKVVRFWKYIIVRVGGNQWHTFPIRSFYGEGDIEEFITTIQKQIKLNKTLQRTSR